MRNSLLQLLQLLLRHFADEDQLMALSQEAMTVADKDWQGIFQNFPREGRPPDDENVMAPVLGILEHEEFEKQSRILATFLCPRLEL